MTLPPSPELEQALRNQLDVGERILYTTSPSASATFRKAVPIVIFAVFWLGITLTVGGFVIVGANDAPLPVKLFIGLFILIGVVLLMSPFFAASNARNTVYAVTNSRALIVTKSTFTGSITTTTFPPERTLILERLERPDGSGDLIFEITTTRSGSSTSTTKKGFTSLPDVNEAEKALVQAFAQQRSRKMDPD